MGQNFFACLPAIAGREALAVLQKSGGASVKEGSGRKLSCLATSWYQGKGPAHYPLGGGEGHRERHFAQQNCLFCL